MVKKKRIMVDEDEIDLILKGLKCYDITLTNKRILAKNMKAKVHAEQMRAKLRGMEQRIKKV